MSFQFSWYLRFLMKRNRNLSSINFIWFLFLKQNHIYQQHCYCQSCVVYTSRKFDQKLNKDDRKTNQKFICLRKTVREREKVTKIFICLIREKVIIVFTLMKTVEQQVSYKSSFLKFKVATKHCCFRSLIRSIF